MRRCVFNEIELESVKRRSIIRRRGVMVLRFCVPLWTDIRSTWLTQLTRFSGVPFFFLQINHELVACDSKLIQKSYELTPLWHARISRIRQEDLHKTTLETLEIGEINLFSNLNSPPSQNSILLHLSVRSSIHPAPRIVLRDTHPIIHNYNYVFSLFSSDFTLTSPRTEYASMTFQPLLLSCSFVSCF